MSPYGLSLFGVSTGIVVVVARSIQIDIVSDYHLVLPAGHEKLLPLGIRYSHALLFVLWLVILLVYISELIKP